MVTGRSPADSTAVIWARMALSTRSDPSWARTGASQVDAWIRAFEPQAARLDVQLRDPLRVAHPIV